MKKIIIVLNILISLPVFPQSNSDLGCSIGAAYYMGDINPKTPFYSPQFNADINYRYNINSRYVLKAEANYLVLSARDADFSDPYQKIRNASFQSKLYDFSGQFEFNFLTFKFVERKIYFSPFVSSGAAVAIILNSSYTKTINFVFPMAVGLKLSLGKKWSTGLEWDYRYTFNDNLDGVVNPVPSNYKSLFNNNDWYSYAAVFITYKVFDFPKECPAYENNKNK